MLPCSAPCNSITLFGLIHLNNIAATDDELTETSCWIHCLLYGWPSQDQFCDPPSYILYLISVHLFDTSIALRCTLLSVYWYYYYMEYILRSLRAAFSGAVRQVATVTRGIGVSGNSILSNNTKVFRRNIARMDLMSFLFLSQLSMPCIFLEVVPLSKIPSASDFSVTILCNDTTCRL